MRTVFKVEKDDEGKLDEVLDEDPVSRLSITKRSGKSLGIEEEGIFIVLEGKQEICEEAEGELEGFAEKVSGDEKEEVTEAIKQEEEKSMKGFGSIFQE
jgi:hypothetical protein